MNIDKRDAREALSITNIGNIKALANLMLRMLDNAVDLNLDYLGNDVAVEWVRNSLLIISNEPKDGNAYPFALRPSIYEETSRLYRMAYDVEDRNAPMSYAPLTLAAQVLANITVNKHYVETEWGPGLIESHRAKELGMACPNAVWVTVNDKEIYCDWYAEAQEECEIALGIKEKKAMPEPANNEAEEFTRDFYKNYNDRLYENSGE